MTSPAGYTVDVRSIVEDLGETLHLDSDVPLPDITMGEETFRPLGPGRLDLTLANTGAGVVASGTVTVTVGATCARCLREFPLEVTGQVEGFYVSEGGESGLPEEQEFGYVTDGGIDLMEQILAALALELPFAPVHAEDCPGICPSCGADLSDGPCGCEPDRSTSPFAGLRDLLPPGSDALSDEDS